MTGTFKSHSTHDLKKRKEKEKKNDNSILGAGWICQNKPHLYGCQHPNKACLWLTPNAGVKMGSGLLKQRRGIKHREIMATNNTTLLLRFLTHSNWVLNRDTAQLGIPASLSLAIFSVKKPFSWTNKHGKKDSEIKNFDMRTWPLGAV